MTPKKGDPAFEVVPAEPKRLGPLQDVSSPLEPEPAEPTLGEYLAVVVEHRWLVAAIAAAAVALGAAYAFLARPVYRSNALVQVEEKQGGIAGFEEFEGLFSGASPAETEIEILRSRSLVGAVVDDLRLDLSAAPRRLPIVGGAFARLSGNEDRVDVRRLEVPAHLLGEPLELVAGAGGRFTLDDPDGARLLEGNAGAAASGRGVEVFVAEIAAPPGTEFEVVRAPRDEAIERLQKDLRIAEKGKKTGILQLSLEGAAPVRIAAVLDALSRAYLRQNVERRSAEAAQTLEFLDAQLPSLRDALHSAETALEDYRESNGGVDVTLETQAAISRAVEVEKALSEIEVERAALRKRFTESHPAIAAMDQKVLRLRAERADIDARIHKLPATEIESARRIRDVKVANELYVALLNKAQELKVVRSGTVGNVRILDAAIVPTKPVAPRKLAVLALSVLLGLGGGIAAAFVRKALVRGEDDPDAIERATGIAVYAAVPESPSERERARKAERGEAVPPLAAYAPKEIATESLRSLRTSLHFALAEAPNRVVSVGGPAPGVGKSFVAANLAHLLGESGRRVLLVDADLRRGGLHRVFGGDRAPGLSDAVGGQVALADAIRETASPNVRLLSSGTIPPNPAELLASERFQRLLAEVSAGYDVVVVDTPPVLAVTDATLVGRLAGVNLLVLRAGRHPMREIAAAVRQAGRAGVRVNGFVMNAVALASGLRRGGAYHYQYDYR
jgi:tyrosine-protein kinase Etk/Wzc